MGQAPAFQWFPAVSEATFKSGQLCSSIRQVLSSTLPPGPILENTHIYFLDLQGHLRNEPEPKETAGENLFSDPYIGKSHLGQHKQADALWAAFGQWGNVIPPVSEAPCPGPGWAAKPGCISRPPQISAEPGPECLLPTFVGRPLDLHELAY